ncbi:MAG: hypothetical protein DYH13_05955 [Alphaproteobacteria bacterium PRO2]|nr:hypothetical protein [Alphaproteobacteria bacterium PRO2]
MVRQLLLGLCAVAFFAMPALAQEEEKPAPLPRLIFLEKDSPAITKDSGHQGYVYDQNDLPYPVTWEETQTSCEACVPLAGAYTTTMQALMDTRYWIAEIEDRKSDIEGLKNRAKNHDAVLSGSVDPAESAEKEKQEAAELSYRMGVEDMAGSLPALLAQEESLKTLGDELLRQLEECQATLCAGDGLEPVTNAKVENPPANVLPFEWKGPYEAVCETCAVQAGQLNEIPSAALIKMAELEKARAELMFAEMELLSLQAEHDGIALKHKIHETNPDGTEKTGEQINEEIKQREKEQADYEKKTRKRRDEMELKKSSAEDEIAKHETGLDAITRNFEETLISREECAASCPASGMAADTGPAEAAATDPAPANP